MGKLLRCPASTFTVINKTGKLKLFASGKLRLIPHCGCHQQGSPILSTTAAPVEVNIMTGWRGKVYREEAQ